MEYDEHGAALELRVWKMVVPAHERAQEGASLPRHSGPWDPPAAFRRQQQLLRL